MCVYALLSRKTKTLPKRFYGFPLLLEEKKSLAWCIALHSIALPISLA